MKGTKALRRIVDWSVRLAGEKLVLEAFASAYSGPDPEVRKVDDLFYLRTARFLQYTDSLDVMNAATPLLQRMCGLLNIYGNYIGEVWAENAVWTDSNGQEGGALASMRMSGNLVSPNSLLFLSGSDEATLESRAVQYQLLAEKDPAVNALLRLVSWNIMGWGDLYMVFEILTEACGKRADFMRFAGITKKELDRFTVTANNYRHAGEPQSDRMHWHEATNWLRGLSKKWLEGRLHEAKERGGQPRGPADA